MAQKNLYVSDRDQPIWDALKRVARQRGTSESQLVTDALADYLPRVVSQPDPRERWDALAADAA